MNIRSRLSRLESRRRAAGPERPPTVEDLRGALSELANHLDDDDLLDSLNRVRCRLEIDAGRGTMREIRRVCSDILRA